MMRDALVNLRFKLLTARMTPRKRPMKEKAAVSIEFHSNSMSFWRWQEDQRSFESLEPGSTQALTSKSSTLTQPPCWNSTPKALRLSLSPKRRRRAEKLRFL